MAGIFDLLNVNQEPLTPQQMGLLGMAAAGSQAYAPQPASRLPLAKPTLAYSLGQMAGGYGQGYGAGLQAQGQQINNLNAALNYNLWAPYLGVPPIKMAGLSTGAPDAASSTASATAPVGTPGGVPSPMGTPPGPASPTAAAGAPPSAAMPPVATRVAGPPMAAPAPSNAAPAQGQPDIATLFATMPPPLLQRMGIQVPPELTAAWYAGIKPGTPEWQTLVKNVAIKASGVQPAIPPTRPGMLPQYYDTATGRYTQDTSAIPALSAGQAASAAATASGKAAVENQNTLQEVTLPNGQKQLMTKADALRVAKGTALRTPPEPMSIAKDETVSPSGTVIPAPPPAAGMGLPGVTTGVPENRADTTKNWTSTLGPSINAESQLTQIASALKTTQSGGLSEIKAKIANDLGGLGPAGQALAKQVMGAKNVADVQTVLHANIMATLDSLKAIVQGSGGRILKTEFEKVSEEALAHPDLTPEANYRIITQMLGILRANRAMVGDWNQASSAPTPSGRQWVDPQKFETSWQEKNPVDSFIKKAGDDIGPLKGMTPNLPKFTSPTDKNLQMLPKGAHFLDANGVERIKP